MAINAKLELKKWFTLQEAAEIVSGAAKKTISIDDILYHGWSGEVKLFINNLQAKMIIGVGFKSLFYMPCLIELDSKDCLAIKQNRICHVSLIFSVVDANGEQHEAFKSYLDDNGYPSSTFSFVPKECIDGSGLISTKYISSAVANYRYRDCGEKITIDDVCILREGVLRLIKLYENLDKHHTSNNTRTENKQAEIIAALAILYTQTDCSRPYEAAETIRQEWERNADKLGNPPTNDTLAKYIKQGVDRISQ